MTGPSRVAAGVRQTVLWVGAAAGVLCILVTLAAVGFGLRPLVFRSGSMAPAIDSGALAIAHRVDAGDLRRADIVSVPTPGGQRVTHRIVSIEHVGPQAVMRLKGDANEAADATPYVVHDADVVLFSVPRVGTAVAWLTSPAGLFVLGLYAAYLASVILRGDARRPRAGRRRKESGRHRGALPALTLPLTAITLAAGVLSLGRTESTLAAWTDPVTVSGTTQAAYTVPAPGGGNCEAFPGGSDGTRGVDLTWPAVAASLPAVAYSASVSGLNGETAEFVQIGSDVQLQVRFDPSVVANQGRTVTVTATPALASAASWTGLTTTWTFQTGGTSSQPVCG